MYTGGTDCVLFIDNTHEERVAHGFGALWYEWDNERRAFPEDVAAVWIIMRSINSDGSEFDAPSRFPVKKSATHSKSDHFWNLSGTIEKPTLSPSLHWSDHWHGWLKGGKLISC